MDDSDEIAADLAFWDWDFNHFFWGNVCNVSTKVAAVFVPRNGRYPAARIANISLRQPADPITNFLHPTFHQQTQARHSYRRLQIVVPKVWRKGAAAVGTECGSQHTRQKHGYRRRRSKSTVIGTNGPLRICASPYTFVSLPTRLETFSTLHSTSKPKHDIVTGDFKSWCPKCGGRVQQRLERNVAVSTRDRNTGIDDDGANRPLLARMGRYASALPRIPSSACRPD